MALISLHSVYTLESTYTGTVKASFNLIRHGVPARTGPTTALYCISDTTKCGLAKHAP